MYEVQARVNEEDHTNRRKRNHIVRPIVKNDLRCVVWEVCYLFKFIYVIFLKKYIDTKAHNRYTSYMARSNYTR